MSRAKEKGTRFETAVRRYLVLRSGDERIERRALHGAADMGDLFGIRARGLNGIAECKAYATVTSGLIERWRDETLCERGNADAGFALLVVKRPRAGIERADVHLTIADLMGVGFFGPAAHGGRGDEHWVSMPLGELCDLMWGAESS